MNPDPTQPVTGTTRSETPRVDVLRDKYERLHAAKHEIFDLARTLERESAERLSLIQDIYWSLPIESRLGDEAKSVRHALTAATQRADAAERLAGELVSVLQQIELAGVLSAPADHEANYNNLQVCAKMANVALARHAATKNGGAVI